MRWWVPSQNGLLLECLQLQSATSRVSYRRSLTGLMSVISWVPSQNGWVFERPQAHHQ